MALYVGYMPGNKYITVLVPTLNESTVTGRVDTVGGDTVTRLCTGN
jgi:hypothetical protein